MTAPAPAWIDRYPHDRALRRRTEIGFWAVVLLVQASFNTVVTWIELRSAGRVVAAWEPLLWELTSALVVAALIPAVAAFERRFVLRWGTLRRHLPWHVLGSVAYCTVHLAGMWALRHAGYAALGERYQHGHVVDFINLGIGSLRTGIFNIADVAVSLGAVLIVFGDHKD